MQKITQIFQNASSLNGPIDQFIESIVTCVKENPRSNLCVNSEDMAVSSCVPQCLLDKYCGAPTTNGEPFSSCTAKQKLFLGISDGIIAKVLQKYKSSQSS